MSAQRRTAVKRDQAAAAPVDAPRRATEARKAASTPGAERPTKAQASKPQTPKAKTTEGKPHPLTARIDSIRRLYRDTRAEMAKITWPDKETTRNLTIVVIGISFVLGVLLGGIDFVFLELLEAMS